MLHLNYKEKRNIYLKREWSTKKLGCRDGCVHEIEIKNYI